MSTSTYTSFDKDMNYRKKIMCNVTCEEHNNYDH